MAVRVVYLTLGERQWSLRFAMSAWAALEDSGHSSLEAFFKTLQASPPSMKSVAVGLWAMLQEEDDRPTLREVMRWIDAENMPEILSKMGEAIASAFPKPQETTQRTGVLNEKGQEVVRVNTSPPPDARGTGTRSSASPTGVSV